MSKHLLLDYHYLGSDIFSAWLQTVVFIVPIFQNKKTGSFHFTGMFKKVQNLDSENRLKKSPFGRLEVYVNMYIYSLYIYTEMEGML